MLERVLEPEVMDTEEEARDYDEMDHGEVNRAFVADFLEVWNRQGPVLDLGTGTAQIPIEFCRQSPEGALVAVDMAGAMLDAARANIRKAGVGPRVQVEQADAKALPYPDSCFPAVMSNSIVHHIPEPIEVIREIARVAKPGATVFVRDLMRPASERELRHLVYTYAAGCNNHQRKMFAESLGAALTVREVQQLVAQFGFDPLTVRASSDRHWTWAVPAR